MERLEKYIQSYGIDESFEEKIERLERISQKTYFEELKINKMSSRYKERFPLFHGIRFNETL